jgi:hypothetical protein
LGRASRQRDRGDLLRPGRRADDLDLHQERNYPLDTGDFEDRGSGAGDGYNLNIPLPPGAGHTTYLEAMERLVIPALPPSSPTRSSWPAASTRPAPIRSAG